LIASKRREAHQKTGEAIEATYQDRLEAFYEVLAHHYSKSQNILKAYQYLSLSAAKAAHSYSNWEAFRLGKQAIRALERLPATEDPMRKGIELRLQLEGAMRLLAYPEDSSEIIEEGIRLCTELEDFRSLAVLYSGMGLCCAFRGDPLKGIEYSRKCVEEAQKVEDAALLATVGFDLCSAYAITGHFAKTVEMAPPIIALLEKHHRESEFLGGPFNFNLYSALSTYYGHALAWIGNFRKGESVCQKALAFAVEIGNLYSIAFAELMYGLLLNVKGEGHRAVQVLRDAIRHAEQGQVVPILIMAHNGLGQAYCCLCEMDSATREMDWSLRIHQESTFSGLLSECRYHHGEVQLEGGDLHGARITAEEAVRLSVVNHQIWVEGSASILLGRVLGKLHRSQAEEAERHIRRGMDILADLGLAPFWAQGSLSLGELYAEKGDKSQAIPHVKTAAEAFKKMGSRYWFSRAQELLQKAQTS
jgi:tetratricopeptide (TPR) repeat protein